MLGPTYNSEVDKSIIAESITINQTFWGEADTDTRFEAGDQALWNDLYGNLPANRRRQFNFNRIRRTVQMVSGHQRRNRRSTICEPVENGDAQTADQFTKILMWVNQREGVLETISESFQGALVAGMNLLHLWVDYRSDPISGNIKVDNCSYNSFLVDPYFRKPDLSDCNGLWKRSYISKREVLSLLPQYTDEIMALSAPDNRDGKFQFMPETYNVGMKNLMSYDEFYYRDYRRQKMLVDTKTGETLEWKSEDNDRLKLYMNTYPEVTLLEQDVPTVRLAIVVQGRVIYDGPNPIGIDRYPFVPVFAYYNPQMPYFPWRIQGMVRGLRDAQYLYNRRKVIELDILESQVASGFIYKENALVNPKDVFMSGQGKGIALKDEAQITDVQQIVAPQIPPSMMQLSELLGKEIQEISGVNEELLGSSENETTAGILSALRQGAGLTTLQSLFDQLDRSQKLLGSLMLDVIQSNFTPGKVQKILEGEQPTPQFYNKAFGKYDAVVDEGFNTTTQKQMHFAQLLQMREIGLPIPDEALIEAATIQDKKKLIEMMQQIKQQAAQAQEMQQQVQMQEIQARTDLARSRAVADQGLGLERLSRIEENKAMAVERTAAAHRDEDTALLNLIKALKEIDGMDLEHIERMVTLAHTIQDKVTGETNEEVKGKPARAGETVS
jgi:hypothetical protein